MSLLYVLMVLVVIGVILWAVQQLPLDATIKRIIWVVAIVFVVLWLVSVLFPGVGIMRVGPLR